MNRFGLLVIGSLWLAGEKPPDLAPHLAALKTENILFVMTDGLRWQEVFSGADEALLNKEKGGVQELDALKKRFWRETATARREALLPFTWGVMAAHGQLYGNQWKGSVARVMNGLKFSYPGYNETFCGFADPRINSNDKRSNPNVTVLEWLHKVPSFQGRVAAFTSWDTFPHILNTERSGIFVNSGFDPVAGLDTSPEIRFLNRLQAEMPLWAEDTRCDAFTFEAALAYLRARKPRVLYVSFDETDAQGHAGRYDRVLASANKVDSYLRTLWAAMQAMPEYRDKTTLILSTDHGRGDAPVEWKDHGEKIARSEYIWIGFLGPDTPALGERQQIAPVTQSQIAATLAALLGRDYCAFEPRAAKPIGEVIQPRR
jgi:hypothetical protein